jgi:hypothetical protein
MVSLIEMDRVTPTVFDPTAPNSNGLSMLSKVPRRMFNSGVNEAGRRPITAQ